ncbi:MAG: radical SAM protein [Planctomycetes bacterium]|nr:radical SAM protein [Planctomycetota bacterium]
MSIGINLNPDTACNFDCIYCQVDRSNPPRAGHVDLDRLHDELDRMLAAATSGALFAEPEFAHTPAPFRRLTDLAFSGDGEPTTCPVFAEAVAIAAELKHKHAPAPAREGTKLILITDACYLTRPKVVAGLKIMDASDGEIWAKLDAGTEAYYQRVNRPNFPLDHVIDNIVQTARARPVTIQSLFMRIEGQPPPEAEIEAYADRLNEIGEAGGRLAMVQICTVARPPAQRYVTSLSDAEVRRIAKRVRDRTALPTEAYYAG